MKTVWHWGNISRTLGVLISFWSVGTAMAFGITELFHAGAAISFLVGLVFGYGSLFAGMWFTSKRDWDLYHFD